MTAQFVERTYCPACRAADAADEIFTCGIADDPIRAYIGRYYGDDRLPLLAGQTYRLDRCRRCGLVYQRVIGDAAFLGQLYDQWLNSSANQDRAEALQQQLLARPLTSRDGHEVMWAAHHLAQPLRGMRTLDYGMGWGLWARTALALGCESSGFDLSDTRMRLAARAGIRVVDESRLAPQYFDFINTEQVLEHVPDPSSLVARLVAALRPGGLLKVSVPYGTDIEKRLAFGDWHAEPPSRRSLNAVAPLEQLFQPPCSGGDGRGQQACARPDALSVAVCVCALSRRDRPGCAGPGGEGLIRPLLRRFDKPSLYVWLKKPVVGVEARPDAGRHRVRSNALFAECWQMRAALCRRR